MRTFTLNILIGKTLIVGEKTVASLFLVVLSVHFSNNLKEHFRHIFAIIKMIKTTICFGPLITAG